MTYTDSVHTQAAVIVLETFPDAEQVEFLAETHLADFPAEEAFASVDICYAAPDFLDPWEQDQFNAWLRDGAECLLVIYMQEGCPED